MDHSLTGIAWRLLGVLALVFANGFFVAAEFSIVTVRKTRIDQMIAEGHRGARAVRRAITDPDSYIAATARRHNLTVVTGNDKHFRRPGLKVFNPFKELANIQS